MECQSDSVDTETALTSWDHTIVVSPVLYSFHSLHGRGGEMQSLLGPESRPTHETALYRVLNAHLTPVQDAVDKGHDHEQVTYDQRARHFRMCKDNRTRRDGLMDTTEEPISFTSMDLNTDLMESTAARYQRTTTTGTAKAEGPVG